MLFQMTAPRMTTTTEATICSSFRDANGSTNHSKESPDSPCCTVVKLEVSGVGAAPVVASTARRLPSARKKPRTSTVRITVARPNRSARPTSPPRESPEVS